MPDPSRLVTFYTEQHALNFKLNQVLYHSGSGDTISNSLLG